MSETVDDFLRSLKVTAGSRFNAAKRLDYVDKWLTVLTSFASAYMILLAVAPSILAINAAQHPIIDMFTVALAVLLLASTVSTYAGGYAVKAEQFHRSALEIQEIRRELRYTGEDGKMNRENFVRLSDEYNRILQKYSLNHDDVDFYRFQTEYPEVYQLSRWDMANKRFQVFMAYRYPQIALFVITGSVIMLCAWILATKP